jgi:hypothetical protein
VAWVIGTGHRNLRAQGHRWWPCPVNGCPLEAGKRESFSSSVAWSLFTGVFTSLVATVNGHQGDTPQSDTGDKEVIATQSSALYVTVHNLADKDL